MSLSDTRPNPSPEARKKLTLLSEKQTMLNATIETSKAAIKVLSRMS